MAERTLIIIKPDAIQRHLAGEIIGRFERKGFKLVAAKFMRISEELARRHYAVHEGKEFFEGAVSFMSSSPSLVMIWEADGAIGMARELLGATFGPDARPGTIRGDFGCSMRFNLVHASDSSESAEYEIGLFFGAGEIAEYEFSDSGWLYSGKD
ncbi:MAG: nucleoside-diphosphate kinase [Phycisphaerales bacterium]|nr:MAG: nucleoside-diphosphate kinase [Phycisphaerales bacterium]